MWEELRTSEDYLLEYLKFEFSKLLAQPYIEEWISGHLESFTAGVRTNMMVGALKQLTM